MIITFLFFLGIFTLTMDIMNGKKGLLALFWNNMRYFIVCQSLYWFIIWMVLSIYQIETITGVFNKINSMGLLAQVELWIMITGFVFVITILLTLLLFKDIPYNDANEVEDE